MAMFGAAVEYALHTLVNLSNVSSEGAPSARDLASYQRLPLAYVRKLMTTLEKAGLVTATKGVKGGWSLARPASGITLLDVAEAVQGPTRLFECRNIRARCALWPDEAPPARATSGRCSIHAAMIAAESAARRELAERTIGSIAAALEAATGGALKEASRAWFIDRINARAEKPGNSAEMNP